MPEQCLCFCPWSKPRYVINKAALNHKSQITLVLDQGVKTFIPYFSQNDKGKAMHMHSKKYQKQRNYATYNNNTRGCLYEEHIRNNGNYNKNVLLRLNKLTGKGGFLPAKLVMNNSRAEEILNMYSRNQNPLILSIQLDKTNRRRVCSSNKVTSSSSSSTTTIYTTSSERRCQISSEKDHLDEYCEFQDAEYELNKITSMTKNVNEVDNNFSSNCLSKLTNNKDGSLKQASISKSLEMQLSSSNSGILNFKHSFDSLLDTVLKNNDHMFRYSNNDIGNKLSRHSSKETVYKYRDLPAANKKRPPKSRRKKQLPNSESVSTISTCSISAIKLRRSQSKIEIGVDEIEFDESWLQDTKLHRRTEVRKKKIAKRCNTMKRRNSLQCELQTIGNQENNTKQANKTTATRSQNDDLKKVNLKKQKDPSSRNLKAPKPHIRELEMFLNFMTKSQESCNMSSSLGTGDYSNKNELDVTVSQNADSDDSCFASCEDISILDSLDAKPYFDQNAKTPYKMNNNITELFSYEEAKLKESLYDNKIHERYNLSTTFFDDCDDEYLNSNLYKQTFNHSVDTKRKGAKNQVKNYECEYRKNKEQNVYPVNNQLFTSKFNQEEIANNSEDKLHHFNYSINEQLMKYDQDVICANVKLFENKKIRNARSKENSNTPKENTRITWNAFESRKSNESDGENSLSKEEMESISITSSYRTISDEFADVVIADQNIVSDFSIHSKHDLQLYDSFEKSDEEAQLLNSRINTLNSNEYKQDRRKNHKLKSKTNKICQYRNNKSFDYRYSYHMHKENEKKLNKPHALNNRMRLIKHKLVDNDNINTISAKKQYSQSFLSDEDRMNCYFAERNAHSVESSTKFNLKQDYLPSNKDYHFDGIQYETSDDRLSDNDDVEVNASIVKSILKKKSSSTINTSLSETDGFFESDVAEGQDKMSQKKSVTFTVPPIDASFRQQSESFKQSIFPTSAKKYVKHSLKNRSKFICGENKYSRARFNGELINLKSCKERSALYRASNHLAALKNSNRITLMQIDRLNRSQQISEYLDIVAQNEFTAYKHLIPSRIYISEEDFTKYRDIIGSSEKKGYIQKFEIRHVTQYCRPICVTTSNFLNVINLNTARNKVINNAANKFIKQNKISSSLRKSKLYKKHENHKFVKPKEEKGCVSSDRIKPNKSKDNFMNYLSNMKTIIKKDTPNHNISCGETGSPCNSSHLLFDVTTTSDAILSLTAYETDARLRSLSNMNKDSLVQDTHSKPRGEFSIYRNEYGMNCQINTSLIDSNEIDFKKDVSMLNITLGNILKQKPINKKRINVKGSIIANEILDHKKEISNDFVEEVPVHEIDFKKDVSTLNITLGNILKQKPINKVRINVKGSIIANEILDHKKEISNNFVEEIPVHDKTDISEENSSIHNFSDEYNKYLEENELIKEYRTKVSNKRKQWDLGENDNRKLKYKNSISCEKEGYKPPFIPYVSKNYIKTSSNELKSKRCDPRQYTSASYRQKMNQIRPQSNKETTRQSVNNNVTQSNKDTDECPGKIHSKSSDALYVHCRPSTSETGFNFKYKATEPVDQNKDVIGDYDQFIKPLDRPSKSILKKSNSDLYRIGSSEEHHLQANRTSKQIKTINADNLRKKISLERMKNNDRRSDNEVNEFISITDSHVIRPVRETESSDTQSEHSFNSIKLRQELESITSLKTKIRNTIPEDLMLHTQLLKKASRFRDNEHVKPTYSQNDVQSVDCYGAPLKNSFNSEFYNEYGKPRVNINGCPIYDKFGIPKIGAYGKPIHSLLRNKLKIALNHVEESTQVIEPNPNFEEDLLHALNDFHGLKTDLYGRVYDFYGRPIFDRYGYIQYDVNGNPLTNAYNKSLYDSNGKPLITTTTCNSTQIVEFPITYKLPGKSSVVKSNYTYECKDDAKTKTPEQITPPAKIKSILSSSDNIEDSQNRIPDKLIKKQVSFDECAVVYADNKALTEPRKTNSLPST